MTSETQINELLAKLFAGEATPEEAMQAEEWKAEDLQNKIYFNAHAKIFQLADDDLENSKKGESWKNILLSMAANENSSKVRKIKWAIGIAASLILLLTIGWLLNNLSGKTTLPIVYSTQSESKNVLLSDGSEILIAPASKLIINKYFGNKNRELALKGSAFFFGQA